MSARHKFAGEAPRLVGKPEPGYFRIRLVKGGPVVGARILYGPTPDPLTGEPLERSWWWAGEINGEPDPKPSPAPTERTWRIWHGGERIGEAEWRYLVADRTWAREHAPHLPEARPRERIDIRTLPLPF